MIHLLIFILQQLDYVKCFSIGGVWCTENVHKHQLIPPRVMYIFALIVFEMLLLFMQTNPTPKRFIFLSSYCVSEVYIFRQPFRFLNLKTRMSEMSKRQQCHDRSLMISRHPLFFDEPELKDLSFGKMEKISQGKRKTDACDNPRPV